MFLPLNALYPLPLPHYGFHIHFSPFVQRVLWRHICHHFGHASSICRSGLLSPFCGKRASKGHSEGRCSSESLKCINCKRRNYVVQNYAVSDTKCPVFIENKKSKIIMAKLGLNPAEASEYLRQHSVDIPEDVINGHHPMWSPPHLSPNRVGNLIATSLFSHDFVILNDGSPTRSFPDRTSLSSPDLSLASSWLAAISF